MKAFSPIFLTAVICGVVATTVDSHMHGGDGWDSGKGGWGWDKHDHGGDGWGWGDKSTQAPPTTTTAKTTAAATTTTQSSADAAKRNIDALYAQCVSTEGGRVIVYAGGDTPGQQDGMKAAFEARFPKVTMIVIVDYSKFHDGRIDTQLSQKKLVPDVVQLQTLQDFPRWRDEGVLLSYKPPGWTAVYDEAKDPNGFFTGIAFYSFTNLVNKHLIKNPADWPREAKDYLKPAFKGHIVLTYPNDDDAILYWFKLVIDKYGWGYLDDLMKQNVTWVRGTQEPYDAGERNASWATPATAGDMSNPPSANTVFLLPLKDPFMSWPQTAAIFKDAKHPACAKLYMSWTLDASTQANSGTWSVRRDVPPPAGYKSIFDYPGQTDPYSFGKWMADRAAVERFKTRLTLVVGEVKGEPSPGHLSMYQDQALPH